MKRTAYIAAALALILSACTTEPFTEEEGNEITIEAVMAENNATRTVIQDGTAVYWEPNDEVKLFFNGTGSRFSSDCTSAVEKTTFTGTLNVTLGFNEGFSDETPLWGLYPYRADATSDGSSVTTTLPAEQTGRAGSFAQGTFITLAKSQSLKMGFYNVCGGLRFSLVNNNIKEIIFEGKNEEALAGKVKLNFTSGVPSVQQVVSGEKSITLTAPNGGTFETGKWYYIVALPTTLSNGFKMTFNTADEYAVRKSSNSVQIKRGVFGSVEDIDDGLVFIEKGTDPQGDNITFKDNAAKFACVAKYDTNGDGEVSVDEAEAATSFSGLFTNWKGVASFDEISYFKNVHSISGVFNDCDKLVSISIPENITDLGTYAFSGCKSLTSVTLPSNITAIGNYTFQNCSKLTSIDVPSKVTSIGSYAFSGCSALSSVNLPSELSTIGNYAFQNCAICSIALPTKVTAISQYAFSGCKGLTQITIPDSVTSLGSYVFSGCTSLATVRLSNGLTTIPQYCFNSCSSLASVDIPSSITSVGNYAFSGVNMWCLELPSSIASLGSSCFGNITCVILPSASAVSIQSSTFDGQVGIFVPTSLIATYRAMTYWTNNSHKLHSLNLYKDKNTLLSSCTLVTTGAADMGTSVKWAAYNVGATAPEEYGDYYAWGETEAKSDYSWSTYFDSTYGSSSNFTKYYKGGSGKTVLEAEDDVAHVKWGGSWRMPTDEEFTELRTCCIWDWTTYNGKNGQMVYSFTGNKIFMPAAGCRYATFLGNAGSNGLYWSSSLHSYRSDDAWYVYFGSGTVGRGDDYRYRGLSVRPVSE